MSKILIADDCGPNRAYLRMILAHANHEVFEAGNGVEALALTRSELPDLVITDIMMPEMDGLELASAIRSHKKISSTKIVFYTASYLKSDIDVFARNLGVSHVLERPTAPAAILKVVDEILGENFAAPSMPSDQGFSGLSPERLRSVCANIARKLESVGPRLSALIALGQQLARVAGPEAMADFVSDKAREIVGSEYAAIGLLDENENEVTFWAAAGYEPAARAAFKEFTPATAIFRRVIDEHATVCQNGISEKWRKLNLPKQHPTISSFLASPIMVGPVTIGLIFFACSPGGEPFAEDDQSLAETLAAQFAMAHENAALHAQALNRNAELESVILEKQKAELELLEQATFAQFDADVRTALSEYPAMRAMLQHCAEATVRWLDAAFARIWTVDGSGRILELQASAGLYTHLDGEHSRVPIGIHEIGRIAQERLPLLTNNVATDDVISDHEWAEKEGMVAFAGFPLMIDIRLVGVMAMFVRKPLEQAAFEAMDRVAHAVALGIDRIQAEAALAESEERLRLAFSSGRMGIFDWDIPTDRIYTSGESKMGGHEIRSFASYNDFLAMVHPEDRPIIVAAISGALAGESEYDVEFRVLQADGSTHWSSATADVVRNHQGVPIRLVGVVRDVTLLKLAEAEVMRGREQLEHRVEERTSQLKIANDELESFAYSVSHDLRSPLRAIDGFARILHDKVSAQIDPEALRYLHLIRENARNMANLIHDLLTFSRLSRQELRKGAIDPTAVARKAWDEVANEREGRTIEIQIDDLPGCDADPVLLQQVYSNLLSNSIKFTANRAKPLIEVGSLRDGAGIVYFVRDNGVGFDMRYVDKVFGVFQRLHRAEDYEGTGVGAAIVQQIIHRHGGRVWATAEVDKGATFCFTLR